MPPARTLLDLPAQAASRRVALGYLEQAEQSFTRLDDPEDAEALHDFRVALRRLRSCLRQYRAYLRDSIRPKDSRRLRVLTEATGPGRDLEVGIDWLRAEQAAGEMANAAQVGELIEWLREHYGSGGGAGRKQLGRRFRRLLPRLRRRLSRYRVQLDDSASLYLHGYAEVTGHLVQRRAVELAARLAEVRSLDDQEQAHRARLVGKRLRYLLEPLRGELEDARPLVKQIAQLQDLLGDLRDLELLRLALSSRARELERAADERHPGLEELLGRLRQRQQLIFAELEAAWLDGEADGFFGRVRQTAAELLARGAAGAPGAALEVERKYLLERMPRLPTLGVERLVVEQGWLPGERLRERLRRVGGDDGERYVRAVKLGAGVSRLELEEETTKEVFAVLWPLTEGRRVRKIRYRVKLETSTWEIDLFTDRDLVLAEIELPGPEAPVSFPSWLEPHVVREVTDDPRYLNVNLAR